MHDKHQKKPGETIFAVILVVVSLVILWQAYGIAGFKKLSSPGAFPMAVGAVMVITSTLLLVQTVRNTDPVTEKFWTHLLPPVVIVMTVLIGSYAILLKPLGFLPTSLVFLFFAIRYLSRRSWVYSGLVALFCLALVYGVFRLIFTVLMPAGIVPEGEILAWFGQLFSGATK